ncbi:MAG: DUF5034 domain-containing protein [Flavobacteriales bacterium]
MKNKILLVLLLPFIAEVFISCCDCEEPLEIKYSHCSIGTRLLDLAGVDPVVVTEPEFIVASSFGIELTLERSESTCFYAPSEFSLFSEAHATSCDCQDFDSKPRETVSDIRVYTLVDFNEEFIMGDDISSLFIERKFNGSTLGLITAIDEIIYDYSFTNYENYVMDLVLTTSPDTQADFQFRVEVELSDGRVLEMFTPVVFLA